MDEDGSPSVPLFCFFAFFHEQGHNLPMRKTKVLFSVLSALLIAGCGSPSAPAATASAISSAPAEASSAAAASSDSVTAAFSRSYTMDYGEGTVSSIYDLDGTLEEADVNSDSPKAHVQEYIHSGGLESSLEGWYVDGRLYNTYNSVNFYEDMSFSSFEQSLLVPVHPYTVSERDTASRTQKLDGSERQITYTLDTDAAKSIFLSHYDVYGLDQYDDFTVTSGTITQNVDGEDRITKEETSFVSTLTSGDVTVTVTATTSVSWLNFGTTAVDVTDDQMATLSTFVNYQDIDTSSIAEDDGYDDTPEATVTDTFKKRLINRLGYTVDDNGNYVTNFNDTESYTIDFVHDQFIYKNLSSTYVYNWNGDTGGFSSICSYDFNTGNKTDGCDDSVVEMIQNVKNFFIMELYYCGLSLSDLQAEVK